VADLVLARIDKARQFLAEAKTAQQANAVIAIAEASRVFAKRIHASQQTTNEAADIRLRAERLLGEILAKTPKNKGANGSRITGSKKEPVMDATPTLADDGLDKKTSSRAQLIAKMPAIDFEAEIAKGKQGDLNSNKVAKEAREKQQMESQKVRMEKATMFSAGSPCYKDLSDVPTGFACLYADPPWQYGNQATRASTDKNYPTMSMDDLLSLPVSSHAADDAQLHLWTTNSFIAEALKLIEAWGFTYKTMLVWVKPKIGIGNYWRNAHELMLLGVRGSAPFADHSIRSWQEHDTLEHSQKPELFRKLIERVSAGPYLELFGRRPIDGWTVWGNEV
jgi:N6-adenosine-specific RNA methylase IME4